MRLLVTVLIVWVFFGIAAAVITPPDIISTITTEVLMFMVFGVVYFVVSRFESFRQTPQSMKTVITALVCLLSVTTVFSLLLLNRCRHLSAERYSYAVPEDPNSMAHQ